jgi:hypothetical protein
MSGAGFKHNIIERESLESRLLVARSPRMRSDRPIAMTVDHSRRKDVSMMSRKGTFVAYEARRRQHT